MPKLIDAPTAAVAARVSEATIRTWVRRGRLPVHSRDGRRSLFVLADVYAARSRAA